MVVVQGRKRGVHVLVVVVVIFFKTRVRASGKDHEISVDRSIARQMSKHECEILRRVKSNLLFVF